MNGFVQHQLGGWGKAAPHGHEPAFCPYKKKGKGNFMREEAVEENIGRSRLIRSAGT